MKDNLCLKGMDIGKWRYRCGCYTETSLWKEGHTSHFVSHLQIVGGISLILWLTHYIYLSN